MEGRSGWISPLLQKVYSGGSFYIPFLFSVPIFVSTHFKQRDMQSCLVLETDSFTDRRLPDQPFISQIGCRIRTENDTTHNDASTWRALLSLVEFLPDLLNSLREILTTVSKPEVSSVQSSHGFSREAPSALPAVSSLLFSQKRHLVWSFN